jgi:FKBP-type peptidyl-prolyl cis-trans isomerase FklB
MAQTRILTMKKAIHQYLFLAGLLLVALATGLGAADKTELKDDKQKFSYTVGMNMGRQYKRQNLELDYDALLRGLKDAMSGGPTLLTETEAREVYRSYQQQQRKVLADKNKKEGEAFLAENAKKEGVKVLPSGLQYKVLTEGTGPMPKTNETVVVHYRGTLIDGKEFDSSYKRGQPMTRGVTALIKGWTEALQLMKVGSKWQLFIPSELAYGERGAGGDIGPNSALIFEVELLSIQPPGTTAAVSNTPPPVVTSDIVKVPSAEEIKKGAKPEIIKVNPQGQPIQPQK